MQIEVTEKVLNQLPRKLIIKAVLALLVAMSVVLVPLLSIHLSGSLDYEPPDLTYGCKVVRQEYRVVRDCINSEISRLPSYDCPGNTTYPELLSAEVYMLYLTNYTNEWVANVTAMYDSYAISVTLWQQDISSSLEGLEADLNELNAQLGHIEAISQKLLGLIGGVLIPIGVLLDTIQAVSGRIPYRVSKRVLGVRVRFSIRVPFDVCDIARELCGIENLLRPLISDLEEIDNLVRSLNKVSIPSVEIPPIPMPPDLPALPPYNPSSYTPLDLNEKFSSDVVDVGGLTLYSAGLSLPTFEPWQIFVPRLILTVIWSFRLVIQFSVNRHSFYSVKERIFTELSKRNMIISLISSALYELIVVVAALVILVSVFTDSSCNSCRLYQYGKITLDLDEFQDASEESYYSCINCIGNLTYCDEVHPQISINADISDCESINKGLSHTLSTADLLLYILLAPALGTMALRNILQLYVLFTSESPNRLSDRLSMEWINFVLIYLERMKILSLALKAILLCLTLLWKATSLLGFSLLLILIIDRKL